MNRRVLIAAAIAAATVAAAAVVLAVSLSGPAKDVEEGSFGAPTHSVTDHAEILARLEAEGFDILTDTDGDTLPDVLENFLYGSDPRAFSTTGNGIPDGWFARFGFDPTRPDIERTPAAVPPLSVLPPAYGGEWPDAYRWSLADVYLHGMPDDLPDGTVHDNGINPHAWESAAPGIPAAWLAHHGLPLDESALGSRSLTGDGFTVLDNFLHDTDPELPDTDGDGLSDAKEVQVYGTDPRRFSTTGSDVPDGWLVRHALVALDPRIPSQDPAGKGMSVRETWIFNLEKFGLEDAIAGTGLDPTVMSHRDDRIPDGWLVDNDIDPIDPGRGSETLPCASDFPETPHLDPQDTPEGLEPIPDLCLTLEDHYLHARPSDWDEATRGPWQGGLDPAITDQDDDGLPDAVELRGWYIQRFLEIGPGAPGEWRHVRSDPLRADTDGDGLTDLEEFSGAAERDGTIYRFPPTDPGSADTALSGMTDGQKVFSRFDGRDWDLLEEDDGSLRPLLDPTRRDTAGDYLPDGDAMRLWVEASDNVQREAAGELTYGDLYPGSLWEDHLQWINGLEWIKQQDRTLDFAAAQALLAPDGDADNDGVPNAVDRSAAGDDRLPNGWKADPSLLRFSEFPYSPDRPRAPLDPANPDTSGDGLPDRWKLQYGVWCDPGSARDTCPPGGGWDLDPSKSDSNDNGIRDDEENMDGDEVLYHIYDGAGTPSPVTWGYTNFWEAEFGTNPRVQDQNGNGVTEGWVVFWSEVYPASLSDEAFVGARVPSPAQISEAKGALASLLLPNTQVGAKDELEYWRFVALPTDQEDPFLLRAENGEEYEHVFGDQAVLDGTHRHIGWIKGTYRHTHADDAEWGLNPYLEDTDGDGLRDAWKAYYAPQCIGAGLDGLHPARPSAQGDPDDDGRSNALEYGLGTDGDTSTNPCLADTDLDGLHDGDELESGLDPLEPADAATGLGNNHSDDDGILDRVEFQRGLDPFSPDTVRNGLLDGNNQPPSGAGAIDSTAKAAFLDHGIAHKEEDCPGGQAGICFFGADGTNGAQALQWDGLVPALGNRMGVPDGWVVYHDEQGAPQSRHALLRSAYECNQPDWWEQPRGRDQHPLGVWWWGVAPPTGSDLVDCPRDRDGDGLDDRNGEDPVPAASQTNHAASIDLQDLAADPTQSPMDLVQAAQAWGDCSGNPEPCIQEWADGAQALEDKRGPVEITGLALSGVGVADPVVDKEVPFQVEGRLVIDCPDGGDDCTGKGTGVPNRAVTLRIAAHDTADPLDYSHTDGRVLGVGFTDATGHFQITGCLCVAPGSVVVPDGIVALGRSDTTAAWTPAAAEIPAGSEWLLGVHAYASTATFWNDPETDSTHPQYLDVAGVPPATSAAWKHLDDVVTIHSGSVLEVTVDAADPLPWQDERDPVAVEVTLRDDSGRPAAGEPVTLSASGAPVAFDDDSLTTDPQGRATTLLNVQSHTGSLVVTASFAGNPVLGLEPVAGATSLVLQAPLTLDIETTLGSKPLGEPFAVTVQATTLNDAPVQGLDIAASVGDIEARGQTDTTGRVELEVTPSGLPSGENTLTVRSAATDLHPAARHAVSVTLVAGSVLQASAPEEASLGGTLAVQGRLTQTGGSPLPGAHITAELGGRALGNLFTTTDGRFSSDVTVPDDLALGSHLLLLKYAGETDKGPTEWQQTIRLSVGTHITLDSVHAGRGQTVHFAGNLTTPGGHNLVGESVAIQMPWGDVLTPLVRIGDQFTASAVVPADHELGRFTAKAIYAGSPNGTFGASQTNTPFLVGTATALETDPLGPLLRGSNTLTGHLLDAETNDPIADARIVATPSVGDESATVTDAAGRFRLTLPISPQQDPGPIQITYVYGGDDIRAPSEAQVEGVLRVPSRLLVSAPSEFGRNTSVPIQLTLFDDRGHPIPDAPLNVRALELEHTPRTGQDGAVTVRLDVPASASLGDTRWEVVFAGDPAHEPVRVDGMAMVKDGARLHVSGMPETVRPGEIITLNVRAEDTAGNPLQTPLVVRTEGVDGAILVETDSDGLATVAFTATGVHEAGLRVTVRFAGTEELAATSESMTASFATLQAAADPPARSGAWWIAAATIALVLLAAVAGLLVVTRMRHTRPSDILRHTRDRIQAGDPWAASVLLAYRRLGDHLRDYGIEEGKTQTARGFAQSIVDAGVLDEAAAVRLVSLVERARYAGGGDLSPRDAQQARQILNRAIQSAQRIESARGRDRSGGGAAA